MGVMCLVCTLFGLAMAPRRQASGTSKPEAKKPFNCRILATPSFMLVFVGKGPAVFI
jgi:hypothetical protein